ncbi:hypothetical protein [Flavobacterium sp. 9AF]|uniref:hypothetical protein n=1 Tax=Flavobacterium sp. 9AF TaxID=2653142 RepID=UPI00135BAD98|nr:hypothetical protein [Flavobacterium sp. 9AF]
MTLHEAIEKVLRENNNFLSATEIATIINSNKFYVRKDQKDLTADQILLRVKNYSSLFFNINGYVLLQKDDKYRSLISSYDYLSNLLRGFFLAHQIQFILAVLYFYKRLIGLKLYSLNKRNWILNDHLFLKNDFNLHSFNYKIKDYNFDNLNDLYIQRYATNGLGLSYGYLILIDAQKKMTFIQTSKHLPNIFRNDKKHLLESDSIIYNENGRSILKKYYQWNKDTLLLVK